MNNSIAREKKFDLPQEVKQVLNDLRRHFSGRNISVVLYGSQTRKTVDGQSDYDINVILNIGDDETTVDLFKTFENEVKNYVVGKYKLVHGIMGVNPTFKVNGLKITVAPKITTNKDKKKNIFYSKRNNKVENFPSLAIRLTKEKNMQTNGEYIKTIIYLKTQLRKFGFKAGGFVLESLLYKVPNSLFENPIMDSKLLEILDYLAIKLKTLNPQEWSKLDRPEKLFHKSVMWKYYLTLYFLKIARAYIKHFKQYSQ